MGKFSLKTHNPEIEKTLAEVFCEDVLDTLEKFEYKDNKEIQAGIGITGKQLVISLIFISIEHELKRKFEYEVNSTKFKLPDDFDVDIFDNEVVNILFPPLINDNKEKYIFEFKITPDGLVYYKLINEDSWDMDHILYLGGSKDMDQLRCVTFSSLAIQTQLKKVLKKKITIKK